MGEKYNNKKCYLIVLLNVLLGIACFERNKKTEINGKLHLEICVVCFISQYIFLWPGIT
jgi:hypothetical protein